MVEEMNWGLDNDRFDVILIGANFLTHRVEPLLKKARAKGRHDRHEDDDDVQAGPEHPGAAERADQRAQACLKWILASDLFDTLVVSMPNYDAWPSTSRCRVRHSDGSRRAVPRDGGGGDRAPLLPARLRRVPRRVPARRPRVRHPPLQDVLRDYGEEKFAMERYRWCPRSQSRSAARAARAVRNACPYGLRVRERLSEADRQLRFA